MAERKVGVDVSDVASTQVAETGSDVVLRLKRIEGQMRGLQRMVEDGRQCGDILTQLLAVRSSLDQVALQVFNEQIDHCLSPQGTADEDTRLRLQESVKLWAKLM